MDIEYMMHWVQRNHSATNRVVRAGAVLKDLAERTYTDAFEPAAEAASRLAGLVDEEFRRHCRVAEVRNGQLLIHVDTAELVYLMRERWHNLIREALPSICRGRSVSRLVFEFGSAGVCVGQA